MWFATRRNTPKQNIASETAIDDSELERVYGVVLAALTEKRLYLRKNLKVSELSVELGFSEKQLSRAVNRFSEGNFNQLINKHRVEAAKSMMASGKFRHYTIEAIADECGFANKVSFYNAFRSIEGMAPREYWALKQAKME